jgi:hypothetical protein
VGSCGASAAGELRLALLQQRRDALGGVGGGQRLGLRERLARRRRRAAPSPGRGTASALVSRTAIGALAAIASRQLAGRGRPRSAACADDARPMRSAVSPSISAPVNSISAARATPTSRGNR